jgi:hypothetical protein
MPLGVTIVASALAPHQDQHALALTEGLQRRGVKVQRVHCHSDVRTQIVICWGWRAGKKHRAAGREVLVMERGYIGDRFRWSSLGWNGLNGRAEFANRSDGGRRFRRHFAGMMRPMRRRGEYVLLIGQVAGDAALDGRSLVPWYEATAARAREEYGLPVVFRPHPLSKSEDAISAGAVDDVRGGDLQAALEDAAVVITWNSNTAVEAVLAGRPTIAMDAGSMAWPVTAHEIGPIPRIGRSSWAASLAWKQFTLEEMANGFALDVVWAHKFG